MTSREGPAKSSMIAEQQTRQQEATFSVLSPEQKNVLDTIESYKNSRTRLVNVHGPSGAGKTFLGWTLACDYDTWSYRPWVPTSPVEATNIVIDNVAPQRVASRRVRELVNFDDVGLAVALSIEPVPEIHDSIRLPANTNE